MIKYLGLNLTKEMKEMYTKNCKTQLDWKILLFSHSIVADSATTWTFPVLHYLLESAQTHVH